MRKSKNLTRTPLQVTTYAELSCFARAFGDGHLNLMILTGGPGLGKSQILKSLVGKTACWIEGHTTAFGMYLRLYGSRGQPVVIDDVDDLHNDRHAVRLLKSLCQTDPMKTISWNSGTRQLEEQDVPHQFQTSSKTAIIANDWQRLNLDVEALEDRGHVVHFAPSPMEVHRQAAEWFDDEEIFEFIGSRLSLFEKPSFRHYVTALELKKARLDWKGALLGRCLSGKLLEVARLKADKAYDSEEQRVRAFIADGHGCRATYFNTAKKLTPVVDPPRLVLKNIAPEPPSSDKPLATSLDVLHILKQRHGQLGNG